MHRGHLEPAPEETSHHALHFLVEEHKVSHHRDLVPDLLERGVGSEREARLDGDALDRDGEVGARHPDPKDVAGLQLARLTQRLLDRFPIGIRGESTAGGPGKDG